METYQLTEQELVIVLKKFYKKTDLTRNSIPQLLKKKKNDELNKAILKFGGLYHLNVKYHLGIKLRHPGRTKDDILDELKELKKKGVAITQQSLIYLGKSGILQSIRKYGTLGDFKAQLGLPVRRMTKWNREKIMLQYQSLYEQWNELPTNRTLYNNGYNDLKGAIRQYFGGIVALRNEMGLLNKKKPDHYWTLRRTLRDFRKFILANRELLKTCSVYGMLKTQKLHGLRTAIGKWGGLKKLNTKYKLGLILQGERWSKEKVERELIELYNKGIIITQSNLLDIGRSDLLFAISIYGTLNTMKARLGIPFTRHNYWTDEKIMNELRPVIEELGSMPNCNMLKIIGKSDVASAMAKRGGHARFCMLLNTGICKSYLSNDGHYLQSSYECIVDNILFKYNIPHEVHCKISQGHNHRCDFLVGDTYIEIAGFTKKSNREYHDNLQIKIKLYKKMKKKFLIIFKEIFTQKITQIEKNILSVLAPIFPIKSTISMSFENDDIRPVVYWADIENVKKELLPLVSKYGRMPLDRELRDERKGALIGGIYRYYGSLYELGQILNIPVLNRPKGYYTYEKAIKIYTDLSLKYSRHLTSNELIRMGLSAMIKIIQENGGMNTFRKSCNLNFPGQQPLCRLSDKDEAVTRYKMLCLENKRFLKAKEIIMLDRALANFIQRHGGYNEIQKLTQLPYPANILPRGYYSQDEVVTMYKKHCVDKGYFLTKTELLTVMPNKTVGYIDRNIGFDKLRKLTGLSMMVKTKVHVTKLNKICLE